jgi:hypothetical protein
MAIHPWNSKVRLMLMLTSYMDETGHSDDPNFHFAGMAGFIAPMATWEQFGPVWQGILDDFKLKEPFHMKEFAHFQGQFEHGWKEDELKRQKLFGQLVKAIVDAEPTPMGAIVSIEDFKSLTKCQQDSFDDPYFVAFQCITKGAALTACDLPNETVAMVYSYNEERGAIQSEKYSINQAGNAEQLWHQMKALKVYGRWMGAYASSTPVQMVQLQAADLFAYELAKEFENQLTRPQDGMRYGLRQILPLVRDPFLPQLYDRIELLRAVKGGRFPCQTGTEVFDDDEELHAISAYHRMLKWMRERGKVKHR